MQLGKLIAQVLHTPRCYKSCQIKAASGTDVMHLHLQVGWPQRPISKVQTALANSFLTSGLYLRQQPTDKAEKSDKLIGLARATSDHVFNATIWDVLVDPAYQVSLL